MRICGGTVLLTDCTLASNRAQGVSASDAAAGACLHFLLSSRAARTSRKCSLSAPHLACLCSERRGYLHWCLE